MGFSEADYRDSELKIDRAPAAQRDPFLPSWPLDFIHATHRHVLGASCEPCTVLVLWEMRE